MRNLRGNRETTVPQNLITRLHYNLEKVFYVASGCVKQVRVF